MTICSNFARTSLHGSNSSEDGDEFSRQAFFGIPRHLLSGIGAGWSPREGVWLHTQRHIVSWLCGRNGVTQADLEAELEHPGHGFRGYHRLARLHLRETDLVPAGWTPHVHAGGVQPDR